MSFAGTTLTIDRVDANAQPRDQTREAVVAAIALAKKTGIEEVRKIGDGVTGAFALADTLGRLMGKTDEKTEFTAGVETGGRAYRVSCATNVQRGGIDERERPSLSCAIAAAAERPDHVWKLEAKTLGGQSEPLSHPVTLVRSPAGESFWMNRPEKRALVRGGDDYSAFIVGKDGGGGPSVGRLVVSGSGAVRLDESGLERSSIDALRIAFAVMSLVTWPEPRR